MSKDRKLPVAVRRKISRAQKGAKNSMYGRKHKSSTKAKLKRLNSGSKNPMFGKKHTAAARKKISLAARRRRRMK